MSRALQLLTRQGGVTKSHGALIRARVRNLAMNVSKDEINRCARTREEGEFGEQPEGNVSRNIRHIADVRLSRARARARKLAHFIYEGAERLI